MTSFVGVRNTIVDRSFVVGTGGLIGAGIVISAKRGTTEALTVTSPRQFIEEFGQPTQDNPSAYVAFRYLQRAGVLTVKRVINDAVVAEGEIVDEIEVQAASAGAWGNNVQVKFVALTNAPAGVFGVEVFENDELVETFEVSRDVDKKNGFGKALYIEDVINRQSRFIRVTDGATGDANYGLATISLSGGADDTAAPTNAQLIDGWDVFVDREAIQATFLINGGWTDPAVQQKIDQVARARGVSVAIQDLPFDSVKSVDAMVEYVQQELGLDSYFSCIYGGWLKVYDQFSDREIYIPPSGDVAASWVNAIESGEYWDAVIGVDSGVIPNTLGTSMLLNEPARVLLYSNNINPITKVGTANAVIWGQKTLQSVASGLDRLNVVNNVLWLNQRMAESLLPYVGKPNTQLTRDNANFMLSAFLESVQRRGGLFGFSVDTSNDINTPQVIDNQEFYVDVYVQPTRVMESIRLRVVVTSTGVNLQ